MRVLLGLGGSQAAEHAGGHAEIETDAEDVARPDPRARQDQHPVLGERGAQLADEGGIASRPCP